MSDYFEGTLQLRNCSKEVVCFVHQMMEVYQVSVADKRTYKNGVDYKVSSNKFLLRLHSELPKKFTGNIKLSRRLYTQDKLSGKNIYRLTLFFEQLPFKEGEIITDKGEKVKVMKIGNKITVKDIKTGKSYFLSSGTR